MSANLEKDGLLVEGELRSQDVELTAAEIRARMGVRKDSEAYRAACREDGREGLTVEEARRSRSFEAALRDMPERFRLEFAGKPASYQDEVRAAFERSNSLP